MKLTASVSKEVVNQPTCIQPALGEKVYTFYDGELTPLETAEFEKHLALCEACRQTIRNQDWIHSALEERASNVPKVNIAGGRA